jgi:hypothetical protein
MPVARGPQINARSAVLVGLSAVVVAGVILVFVVWLAGQSGDVEIQLGDRDFRDINAAGLAEEVAAGGPILWSDVAGGERDIILNHLGDDPQRGWHAFDARPTGETRDCNFEWDDSIDLFVLLPDTDDAVCSNGTATATGEGDGVTIYPVDVVDGGLRVDINFESADDREPNP